jgi:hypothetical protein
LNYPSILPIVVALKAALNKHWRVVFTSATSLALSFMPALAANMFYQSYNDLGELWMFIYTKPFYIVVAYMAILLAALFSVIPDQTRYLPHDVETLSEQISFIAQSSLLEWDEFCFSRLTCEPAAPKPRTFAGRCLAVVKYPFKLVQRLLEEDHKSLMLNEFRKQNTSEQFALGARIQRNGTFVVGIDTADDKLI